MIAEKIKHAIADFESRTGVKPNYVYLGLIEWDAFTDHCESARGEIAMAGMYYLGSQILYVSKLAHLSVGI